MSSFDLRNGLAEIATEAQPVDLYARAVRRSRQIRRRRSGLAVLAAAVAVGLIAGTWQLMPGSATGPVQPGESPSSIDQGHSAKWGKRVIACDAMARPTRSRMRSWHRLLRDALAWRSVGWTPR